MSASAAASQGSGVRYMERPAVPRALDTEEENHAVLAVQSSPHLRAGHQPSWMLNHMMPHGHAAGFGYSDPRHAHAEHCKSMREVQENAQQHHMKRMHEVATEPLHSRDYTPWTGAAMTSGMTGGAPASETLYSRDVVPGTNNGTFEALSHPMPGSATWQYFYDQSPAAQKPVLEPNVAADKHLPKQPTMEEMQTWYFSHPASVSSTVDVPDFRNYGHGPYHGRVGPYPYATHPHAPAAPPQPTRPQYDKILDEALSGTASDAIELTAREKYIHGMNAVTRLRNERLLEEYKDLPSKKHVHPHPRPRTLEYPNRTRFTEALMSLREEQAEYRCIAIDYERDMVRDLRKPFEEELNGYRKAKNLVM